MSEVLLGGYGALWTQAAQVFITHHHWKLLAVKEILNRITPSLYGSVDHVVLITLYF